MIRLEPRAIYDAAIIGQDGDRLVYCYYLLLDVITDQNQKDLHISRDEAQIMALDHISYNIEGMALCLSDWPIIKREGDEQSEEE